MIAVVARIFCDDVIVGSAGWYIDDDCSRGVAFETDVFDGGFVVLRCYTDAVDRFAGGLIRVRSHRIIFGLEGED